MSKKYLTAILSILFTISIIHIDLSAEVVNDDSTIWTYSALPTAFYIGTSADGPWTTIFEDNTQTVNIAAGSVGNQIGAFSQDVSVPIGTYTHYKVTLTNLTDLKGCKKDSSDNWWVTDPDQQYGQTTLYSGSGRPSESDCGTITFNGEYTDLPDSFTEIDEISGGLTIDQGESVNLSIIFGSNLMGIEEGITVPDGSGGTTTISIVYPADANPVVSES